MITVSVQSKQAIRGQQCMRSHNEIDDKTFRGTSSRPAPALSIASEPQRRLLPHFFAYSEVADDPGLFEELAD